MMKCFASLCFVALAPRALAQVADEKIADLVHLANEHEYRKWTSVTGASIEGGYMDMNFLNTKVRIHNAASQSITILPVEQLSAADRAWLDARRLRETKAIPPVMPDEANGKKVETPEGLREQPANVARNWKECNFKECSIQFDNFNDACAVATLLWWDDIGWLPVPKGDDAVEKATWLAREIRSKKRSVGGRLAVAWALRDYVAKHASDQCQLDFIPTGREYGHGTSLHQEDFSWERVQKEAAGTNACFLILDSYDGSKDEGYVVLPVMEVVGKRFSTQVSGVNFDVELQERKEGQKQGDEEFHIVDDSKVPSCLQGRQFRLRDDWFLSARNHVFAQRGKPVTLKPKPPLFENILNATSDQDLTYMEQKKTGKVIAANDKWVWFWEKDGPLHQWETAKCDQSFDKYRLMHGQKLALDQNWKVVLESDKAEFPWRVTMRAKGDRLSILHSKQLANTYSVGPEIFVNLSTGVCIQMSNGHPSKVKAYGKLPIEEIKKKLSFRPEIKQKCQERAQNSYGQDFGPDDTKLFRRKNPKLWEAEHGSLALFLAAFPPTMQGDIKPWPSAPTALQPMLKDLIIHASCGYLIGHYGDPAVSSESYTQSQTWLDSSLDSEFQDFTFPQEAEAAAMEPGTWKVLP